MPDVTVPEGATLPADYEQRAADGQRLHWLRRAGKVKAVWMRPVSPDALRDRAAKRMADELAAAERAEQEAEAAGAAEARPA